MRNDELHHQAIHQLRRPPDDFTGRSRELASFTDSVVICGLRGMGGVGKTSLALKLADDARARFPEAQFDIDLRGTSSNPLRPKDVMARVVRSFDRRTPLPDDDEELATLYRSLLSGKRAIVLLDNARDAAQVEALIPPKGCLLIVTSRTRFVLPGLQPIDLGVLTPGEAEELLRKIAAHVGEAAEPIATLCGYLPLALRLAGSALAERPTMDPNEYAARLADEQERLTTLDQVYATFRLSFSLLPSQLQACFAVLAVFPADFDAGAASSVWKVSQSESAQYLAEFVRRSLVEWDQPKGRYRLHDLVRDFAQAVAPGPDLLTAGLRHSAHYLHVAVQAEASHNSEGRGFTRGLALFDIEWANIQRGFEWASEHCSASREAASLVSQYPNAVVYCFDVRLHPAEKARWCERGLSAARELGDRRSEAGHLANLGIAYADLGDNRQAIGFYEQHVAVAREIGDHVGEGNSLDNIGVSYRCLGEYHRAKSLYEEHIDIARSTKDRVGEARAVGNLGNLYSDLGDHHRALKLLKNQLELSRGIDARSEARALASMGVAYRNLGEPERAIEFLEASLSKVRSMTNRRVEGKVLGALSAVYLDCREFERALNLCEESARLAREVGNLRGEADALNILGQVYDGLGQEDRALHAYERCIAISSKIGERRRAAVAKWNMGLISERKGDTAKAADLMTTRVEFEREIGHPAFDEHVTRLRSVQKAKEQGNKRP